MMEVLLLKENEAREVSFIPRARTEFAFKNFFFYT